MHKREMTKNAPSEIFSRRRRAVQRDRAARGTGDHFLYKHMVNELLERLSIVQRQFSRVLVIGCPDNYGRDALRALGKDVICCDPSYINARNCDGIQADEDMLPFADNSFDLVMACGTLDSVNDLPGALVLMQKCLRPDGLMLAALFGAGSLDKLRAAMRAAEPDAPCLRTHPQIDVRSAGDLLQRTGFSLPVADCETLQVRYGSLLALISDLRSMGANNALADVGGALTRTAFRRAIEYFGGAADKDGRTSEEFSIIYLSGWKPDPSQPAPARRGSATVSLAEALRSTDNLPHE